ncbi:MAG TPA: methyltransferase domain-containing protein [Bryobacteraceae bacterium]|nr:methyltransferase domain-containing protein [Bryobacteraceae bacterium]
MDRSRLDIRSLAGMAAAFQKRIGAIQAAGSPGFDWYPYDSLGNFFVLADLLTGERRFLLDLIGNRPALDVGCGDGHIAFFLESLGCKVIAVDNPRTNYNQMQGVRALKAALNSSIEICEQDIDYDFRLPDLQFSVAIFLGVLYHLKNPFRALETLVTRSQYCLLSTRVTRFAPDRKTDLGALPLAYLVNETETNNDSTNFWIFTNPGLKRLIERSGWRVVDYASVGNSRDSDPITAQGDERAFCLAERAVAALTNGRLLSGWHQQETFEAWRWTEKKFAVVFPKVSRPGPHVLRLDFFLPDGRDRLSIACSINGTALAERTFVKSGHYRYEAAVPDPALTGRSVLAEFGLSDAFAPGDRDERELGIVVSSVQLIAVD